jgi:S-adenosylmethionine-diacylglycerol 3-amino-3-carboxypropyl transferase
MSNKYFQGLNYTLANEDTWVEYDLLPENVQSVFTVCGSGSRAIPFLAKNPVEMHVVDLSDAQLRLFRLRLASIKALNYEEYLYFLGYTNTSPHNRLDLFKQLDLSSDDQIFWQSHASFWKENGFIYLGKWERHFMMLGKIYHYVTRTNLYPIFASHDLIDQQKNLRLYWKSRHFKLYSKILLNEWIANKLLYKGHFAGSKDLKTTKVTTAQYVYREFTDLLENTWVKENYFMQMIFLGKVIFPEAFPCECDKIIFDKVKKSQTKVYYHQKDLLSLVKEKPHDFYSLSDTFSYMTDAMVKDFLSALPTSIPYASKIVIRTFMRKPSFKIDSPWEANEEKNIQAAKEDCTRMYDFMILTKV